MKQNYMMTADEVANELGVSKGKAYKLIKDLNAELLDMGFEILPGKLPRAFLETKFYGYSSNSVAAST